MPRAKKKKGIKNWFSNLNNWSNDHEWVLLLITIMFALRLPTLWEPFWYGDENIYLAIGQALRRGMTLYTDVTDYPNKLPMIYWLSAWLQSVPNMRFFLMLWQVPGVIFFHRLVNRLVENTTTAFFATLGFIFLTSTPIIEGTISNGEIFFIVPTIIGVSLLADVFIFRKTSKKTRAKKKRRSNKEINLWGKVNRFVLAGIFLGLALSFKIHVLLDIVFIGLFFFIFPYDLSLKSVFKLISNKQVWQFLSGVLGFLVVVLGYLSMQGVFPTAVLRDLSVSSAYTQVWSSEDRIMQTLGMGDLLSRTLFLLILIGVLYVVRKKLDKNSLFAILWTLCALFAALLSGRSYPHYLIQVVPALVITVSLLFHRKNLVNNLALGLSLVIVVLSFIRFDFSFWGVKSYYQNFASYVTGQIDTNEYYRRFDNRMPRNYAAAKAIRSYTLPDDQIYIWGTEPGIYVLSNRVQVGPLVTSFHVDDLTYYDETLKLIKQEEPEMVVVPENEWRHFQGLEILLKRRYFLVETVGDPDKSKSENQNFKIKLYKRSPYL